MTDRPIDPEYASWTEPGSPLSVVYDLGVFHEVDFITNEAFRRIPHGGIEVGGILLGRLEPDRIRIDAFRMIECEHAFGPSFNLSERDLANLQSQLAGLSSDPELEGLETVGWFIAHNRSPLKLNEREAKIFNDVFAGTGKLTVLIKPERFQPTRFAFLVRAAGKPFETDGTAKALILPNAGRGGTVDAPIPSIPAPAPKPSVPPPPKSPATPVPKTPAASPTPQPKTELPNFPRPRLDHSNPTIPPPAQTPPKPRTEPVLAPDLPAPLPPPRRPVAPTRVLTPPDTSLPIPPAVNLRSAPVHEESRPAPSASLPSRTGVAELELPHRPGTRRMAEGDKPHGVRLLVVLILAAALGCGVGYLAYLQLPPPVIPLSIRSQPPNLLVSWPASQTRNTSYAAIRVNDGEPMPLSAAERSSGEAQIAAQGDNVKVEVISQHWIRDSRGIIRYVKAQRVPSPPPAGNATPGGVRPSEVR